MNEESNRVSNKMVVWSDAIYAGLFKGTPGAKVTGRIVVWNNGKLAKGNASTSGYRLIEARNARMTEDGYIRALEG